MKTARYFYYDKDLNTKEIERDFPSNEPDRECLNVLENECRARNDFRSLRMGYVLK